MAAHQAPPSLGSSRQELCSGLPFPSPVHESEKWKWRRSVVSDSSRPHGLQPTRLLHPWDFPGKSTGVGCHCLLQLVAIVTTICYTPINSLFYNWKFVPFGPFKSFYTTSSLIFNCIMFFNPDHTYEFKYTSAEWFADHFMVSECMLSHFSHEMTELFATLWTIAHQASLSKFSKQEYCTGLPCPPAGNHPNPVIKTMSHDISWIGRYFPYH